MSKTCTTKQSVWYTHNATVNDADNPILATAKKEDDPEGALKDFKGIVEQEEEKGDW